MRATMKPTRLLAAGLLGLAVLLPPDAGAQTCIPLGNGGAYAPGPPRWYQASAGGFARFNTWVDDPRWSGAMAIDYGEGTTREMQFRALYNGSDLFLSWWHKA